MIRATALPLSVAVLVAAMPVRAQDASAGSLASPARAIRNDVLRLTSPEMEGRGTGEVGGARAARLIAGRLSAMGMRPLGDSGDFLQRVPLHRTRQCTCSTMRAGGITLRGGADFVGASANADSITIAGRVAIVTMRLDSAAVRQISNWPNDNRLRNAIAVVVLGDTTAADAFVRGRRVARELRKALEKRGASAIAVVGAAREWNDIADRYARPRIRLAGASAPRRETALPAVVLADASAARLVAASGQSLEQLRAAARDNPPAMRDAGEGALELRTTSDEIVGFNVAGVLPGADSALAREALIYSAHYDAFGRGGSGRFFPGAADNAVGVGILLSIASALAERPTRPRRSTIFLALTGEEHGLLGSLHYVAHPTWPLDATIANVNIDGIGTEILGPLRSVVGYGADYSDVGEPFRQAAARARLTIADDPFGDVKPFFHSDQFAFARAGVPALMLLGLPAEETAATMPKVRRWIAESYHTTSDTVRADWSWDGAAGLASLALDVGVTVANADARPRWSLAAPFPRWRRAVLIGVPLAAIVVTLGVLLTRVIRRRRHARPVRGLQWSRLSIQ